MSKYLSGYGYIVYDEPEQGLAARLEALRHGHGMRWEAPHSYEVALRLSKGLKELHRALEGQ